MGNHKRKVKHSTFLNAYIAASLNASSLESTACDAPSVKATRTNSTGCPIKEPLWKARFMIRLIIFYMTMEQGKSGVTHELQASRKPFSIAGMKFEGIACPIILFSNSNFTGESIGRGSMYLNRQRNNIISF